MFNFIKNTLTKVYNQFTAHVNTLFARHTVDEHTLSELETLLIAADTGVITTKTIIANLTQQMRMGTLRNGDDLRTALHNHLAHLLSTKQAPTNAQVYVLVGINGSGKTTFVGKMAHRLQQNNQRVLLVAADTFRAAAVEQLTLWANRTNTSIITGKPNQDPASIVFAGCQKFKQGACDTMIIDTAGRLQTKVNLMRELEKIRNIITQQLPSTSICTLLTIDAMLGQNSFEQARLFNESTQVNGIVLTKMDGTGKGGIVFSISQELDIPIAYISFGEGIDQLKFFDPVEYVQGLIRT